ncbi:hypothetical protein PSQ39_17460 [Curvibacter sp. HBC28]|uniref:Uncharacterized protein n=1 Tax=Curvibacter microcysteis TaxID=3026419 RepID=A0ABT5MIM5_9BURK|nr:hypothetical protein [Curvibacter sp. HBC28]MDD0816431.1 hypothetical protein [Curvibacter sp. HBC28]
MKPKSVHKHAKAKQRRIKGCFGGSKLGAQSAIPKGSLDILDFSMSFLLSERNVLLAVKDIGLTVADHLEKWGVSPLQI